MGQVEPADEEHEALGARERVDQARNTPQGIGELQAPEDEGVGEGLHSEEDNWPWRFR